MPESSDDWASEDDEQLSQSLSQSLSQEPPLEPGAAAGGTQNGDSDDSWASEDDTQLSQDLLSQQGGEAPSSQLVGWVSPRMQLENAMSAARGESPTLDSIGTALDGDQSSSGSESDDDPDVHPLLRRCTRNELELRLGVAEWRREVSDVAEAIEGAQVSIDGVGQVRTEDCSKISDPIGQNWTQVERHAFFRALRRCGKHPHNISERIGTKSPIEVAVYLRQLQAASEAYGTVDEREDGDSSGSSTEDEAEAEDAGDCHWTSIGFRPKRQAGRFPGGRCPLWPACEGDKPLPSNSVWDRRGWAGLGLHEQEALKLLGLNNLARYLAQKLGHHSFASYDSAAALELHAQLVALLASVLSAARTRAMQRLRSRDSSDNIGRADTGGSTVVITVSDVAAAAAGIAPHRYSESLVRRWALQPLPSNPFGTRTYRPVTERSAVWTQTQPSTISIGNQQIVGPICALPSAPPSIATMVQLETKMREGTLRRAAFTENEIQRAVELGPVGGGIIVGMETGEKLDLTSPELLFLHHSILRKLHTRQLYQQKATKLVGVARNLGPTENAASNIRTTLQVPDSCRVVPSSSSSETAAEINLDSQSESDQQMVTDRDEADEADDDDEAAAVAQEEAERELARAARAARLAAQRADPAARRAGYSPDAVDDQGETDRGLNQTPTHFSEQPGSARNNVTEQHEESAGARDDDGPCDVGICDGATKKRKLANQPDSDNRRKQPRIIPPVCFQFQWDTPLRVGVDEASQEPQQELGGDTHACTEFPAEWSLLYPEYSAKTANKSQLKRKRQQKSAAPADTGARAPRQIAPIDGGRERVQTETGAVDGTHAGGTGAGADTVNARSVGGLDLTDDFATGIDLLTALAAGNQRDSDSLEDDDFDIACGSDGDSIDRIRGAERTKIREKQAEDSLRSLRSNVPAEAEPGKAAKPPSAATLAPASAAGAKVAAGLRKHQSVCDTTRTRSVSSPWDNLVHNLLQQAHHDYLEAPVRGSFICDEPQPASRTSLTVEPPAAHVLRMLAESFLRRRWEQAIAAATHARRVVVLRADVALWATDEVSKRGATLQSNLARCSVAKTQKLRPGDRVRIPFGKRAFAKCTAARQQPRAAVAKNSLGRVVSCANGYYTVSLDGGSTCKLRRSDVELLI